MIPIFETVPVQFDCGRCTAGDCGSELLRRFDAVRPLQAFVLVAADDPRPLLQRLQAERPGLFEWSPLHEGPPVWKIEIARRAAPAAAPDITEAIEWDHDRLDRLRRTAYDAWGAGDSREAEEAFSVFAHGLRRHIGFEEAVVFPELSPPGGSASGDDPAAALRTEHRQILALLSAIELAIRSERMPTEILRRHLQDVLRAHEQKEEQTLYPVTEAVLTPAQRDDVIRRIQLFRESGGALSAT